MNCVVELYSSTHWFWNESWKENWLLFELALGQVIKPCDIGLLPLYLHLEASNDGGFIRVFT